MLVAPTAGAMVAPTPTVPSLTWSAHHDAGYGNHSVSTSLPTAAGPMTTDVDLGYRLNDTSKPTSVVRGDLHWRFGEDVLQLYLGVPRWLACRLGCEEGAELAEGARLQGSASVGGQAPPRAGAPTAAGGSITDAEAAAVAGGVSVVAIAWWLFARGGWLAFYSRLGRSKVTEDPRRQAILALLAQRPGLTPAEIAKRLGIPRTSTLHHLAVLRTHELVRSFREGRRTLYARCGQKIEEAEIQRRAVLDVPARAAVLEALAAHQRPLTQKEIAESLGLPRRTVAHHLQLLARRGLVVTSDSRPLRYSAPSERA